MTLIVHCPKCQVELTIPKEAGSKRLRCPKCATRFFAPGSQRPASDAKVKPARRPGPASSILAQSVDQPDTPRKAKVPPSSGQHPARGHGNAEMPTAPGDLRDFLDIPLADDSADLPYAPPKGAADAAALFRDDPPAHRRHRSSAESRSHSRTCPDCGAIVPVGMALCGKCGLDLDSGQRYEVEEYEDVAPPPPRETGPPAPVLMIGLVTLIASLLLAGLSLFQLEGLGRLCLVPVCLFGAFGAIQFLRGKTMKLIVVALMLGGAVNILTQIVLPVIQADVMVADAPPMADDEGPKASTPARPADEDADPGDSLDKPIGKPLSERIDYGKVMLGVVVLLLDAVMLISLATPGVRRYFEHHRRNADTGYVLP